MRAVMNCGSRTGQQASSCRGTLSTMQHEQRILICGCSFLHCFDMAAEPACSISFIASRSEGLNLRQTQIGAPSKLCCRQPFAGLPAIRMKMLHRMLKIMACTCTR